MHLQKYMQKTAIFSLLFLFLDCGNLAVEAVPINSDIGLTPYKGQFILRTQARYTSKADDPTGQNRKVETFFVPFVGVYGITSKASVLLKVPYINRDQITETGLKRGDQGLGDITLLGKYRLYTKDYKGATSRFSLLGGLELPTGEDDESDSTGVLPQTLQLGSGSFDFIAGGAYTYQSLDYEWDVDFKYKFNQEANNFKFGDEFNYNFAYQKRFSPWILPERGLYDQWNAVLEFNGIYTARNELAGNDVFASGGNTLFLSPGIQFASQRMVYEFSYQYPILQNLHGNQLEIDYKLAFSFRYTF